jgi:hypothetical protein
MTVLVPVESQARRFHVVKRTRGTEKLTPGLWGASTLVVGRILGGGCGATPALPTPLKRHGKKRKIYREKNKIKGEIG